MISEVVYGEDLRFIEWAESKLPGVTFRVDARAIGTVRDGEVVAAVVFDTFTPNSCLMHVASDGSKRWLTRDLLVQSFAYPFLQCGFARVTSPVSVRNIDSVKIVKHFGFTLEGRLREEGADGEDMLLFGMLRRECRFLPALFSGHSTTIAV